MLVINVLIISVVSIMIIIFCVDFLYWSTICSSSISILVLRSNFFVIFRVWIFSKNSVHHWSIFRIKFNFIWLITKPTFIWILFYFLFFICTSLLCCRVRSKQILILIYFFLFCGGCGSRCRVWWLNYWLLIIIFFFLVRFFRLFIFMLLRFFIFLLFFWFICFFLLSLCLCLIQLFFISKDFF